MERRLKAELPQGEVSLCGHEPRLEQRKTRTSHRIRAAGLVVAAHRAGDWSASGNGGRLSSRRRDCAAASRNSPSKAAIDPITDSKGGNSKAAIEVITGFLPEATLPEQGSKRSCGASEAYREMIELELSRGRNAMGIWQDLVDSHGFAGGYQSVRRLVRNLRGAATAEARAIIETPAGEEAQVDYGTGPMVRDPDSGKYRRTRLFVLTLGWSRKSVRLLVFRSSARVWAELHEKAFRRLGGSPRIVVLDNLREGVLSPDFYDPGVNPLYRDVLTHYSVTALPCKVRDPDRKGKVESGVNHAQMTPLKGKKFESLEEAQAYLDHWEERWADKRIHGRTKRQVAAMFGEEKPLLQTLPLEPFRYYQYGERTVHIDGCVEVDAAYYGAPPGWIGRKVNVQWDAMFVRLLDPRSGILLREHLSGKRGAHRIRDADRPRRTPPPLLQLLARAHKAGANIGAVCDAIHARQGELGMRRIQGVLQLVKQYGSVASDDACAAALELRVPEYRFVRRYLERRPQAPLTLRQVDPLIRELSQYRDLIQQRINFEEPNP
ncbi:MAG TPA: IS21 family transposase [Acidobacteriaceae bacterium]|nr:IS21 family transposase [Acidobacteriaceae bacterium]